MSEETVAVRAANEPMPEGTWAVKDKLVKPSEKQRVHTVVIDGEQFDYTMERGKWTQMPKLHAAVFLRTPEGFDVIDENRDLVQPIEAVKEAEDLAAKLPPGTVIAKLEELTHERLLDRAPAEYGLKVNKSMSKPEIIEKMIAAEKKKRADNTSYSADDDPNGRGDMMSQSDLDRFFGDTA